MPKLMVKNTVPNKPITRGMKSLIRDAINETGSNNRNDLCTHICDTLEKRFPGETLTYQLKRMRAETTGQILDAIDTYAYKYSKDVSEDLYMTD